ncbi:MAG TPA: hypothetical protein VLQ66_00755 [Paenisporosarcina sp.]|nr:hypothetical protein [Paenisporosarcina sp.]
MTKKDVQNPQPKEKWKIWDAVFFSSMISLIKDNKEAQTDDEKFKQLIYQMLFAMVFTALVFAIAFWVIS